MLRLLLPIALSSYLAAKDAPCPQIDPQKKYPDGIAYCPETVKDNAFSVTRCAYNQAKKWHPSDENERRQMNQLIEGFKASDSAEILKKADVLDLQVCRSQKGTDSFLLAYTKPKVADYSGPFLMFREGGKTSNIVLHSPHDGQDGTHRSTKDAFQNSNALALISNGHPRCISGKESPSEGHACPSDWAHKKDDLGFQAFLAFKSKFDKSIHLHIHGLKKDRVMVTDSVGWDGADHSLRTAFIKAFEKALVSRPKYVVTDWRFNGWITGIAMTQKEDGSGRAANNRWVGAEVAVDIHMNTKTLTQAVVNLERDYLNAAR